MATFVSKNPTHQIGHPSLFEAAGSDFFIVRFKPQDGVGVFKTEDKAVADALRALVKDGKVRGVKELPEKGEQKPDPNADQGDGGKGKK